MKKTPLYEKHLALGGKMTEFGRWLLPVQYTGILEEHRRVRDAAGLFDVSHMGEVTVTGPRAGEFVEKLVTNAVRRAENGRCIYSPMCAPDGGVVDDLLVYKRADDRYLIVVNAANTDKDFEWMRAHAAEGAELCNVSGQYAQLAVQGPRAQAILQKLTDTPLEAIRFYRFREGCRVNGAEAIVSRTGYTGEDGFEVYVAPDKAPALWDAILEAGRGEGIVPVGLGARDTLRFEAALPLYGHELSDTTTPLEAGLSKFVKFDKGDFIGRDALLRQSREIPRTLVGLEMTDRGIARAGCEVRLGGRPAGAVTTGTFSPTLRLNIAMALVDSACLSAGEPVSVVIRGKELAAKRVELPFYTKKYKK